METTYPSFEKFEEIFQDESCEEDTNFPNFTNEWRRKLEKCFLLSMEAGVLVISMDISQFVFSMHHRMILNISYKIKNEIEDSSLLVNVANFMIMPDSIFKTDLDFSQEKEEIYKNILALTCVSDCISLKIYMHVDLGRLLDFFAQLSLQIINEYAENHLFNFLLSQTNANTERQYILYCHHGYFSGVLIRMKQCKRNKALAKVYVRSEHQLVNLMQSIYQSFPFECTIKFC